MSLTSEAGAEAVVDCKLFMRQITTGPSVGIAVGVGGSTPQLFNVFNPLVVLLCLSWGGVRNNPHGSQLQTLICHHIPQVIEPCHCCQAYIPYSVIIQLQYVNIISVL